MFHFTRSLQAHVPPSAGQRNELMREKSFDTSDTTESSGADPALVQKCAESLRKLETHSALFQRENQMGVNLNNLDKNEISEGTSMGKGRFNRVRRIRNTLPGSLDAIMGEALLGDPATMTKIPCKKYAIKRIRSDLSKSMICEGAIDLAKEAKFLYALSHPNIINLYGAASNPGSLDYALVIEELEVTLTDKLEKWRKQLERLSKCKMPKKQLVYIQKSALDYHMKVMVEVASGMKYLHERNILYRDLKPDNIGLDREGNVKIFDFGIATELKEVDKIGLDKYNATAFSGTPRYMAKEVFIGQPYGLPADVYSFALVLYEVASLEQPFMEMSLDELSNKVHGYNRRPSLSRALPKKVRSWIKKSWHSNPSARPKITSLYDEMRAYLVSKEAGILCFDHQNIDF